MCDYKDACEKCTDEFKKKHRCYKAEGAKGICLLACQIESAEDRERYENKGNKL